MRGEGFTLVELIVVLAILAGLAALVAPSFSRTVASARRDRRLRCRSTFARARALAVASSGSARRLRSFAGGFGVNNEAVRLLPETIRLGAVVPGGTAGTGEASGSRSFPTGEAKRRSFP